MSPAEEGSREQDTWGVRDRAKAQEGGGSHGVRCVEMPGRVRQVPSKRKDSRHSFMVPGYSSYLSISISPSLTLDLSASWRVLAAAARGQDSPPPCDSHIPDFPLTRPLAVLLPHL